MSSIFIGAFFFQLGRGRKKLFFLFHMHSLLQFCFFYSITITSSPLFFANPSKYPLFRPLFYLSPSPISQFFFRIFFSFSSLILFPSVRPALLPLSHIHFFSFLFFSKIVPKSISDQRLHLSFSLWWPYRTFFPRPMFPPSNDVFHTHSFWLLWRGFWEVQTHGNLFTQSPVGYGYARAVGLSIFLSFPLFLPDIPFFLLLFLFFAKEEGKTQFLGPGNGGGDFFAFVLFFWLRDRRLFGVSWWLAAHFFRIVFSSLDLSSRSLPGEQNVYLRIARFPLHIWPSPLFSVFFFRAETSCFPFIRARNTSVNCPFFLLSPPLR